MYDAAERIYGCQETVPLLTFRHRKNDLNCVRLCLTNLKSTFRRVNC
jgi:hypothetical protein